MMARRRIFAGMLGIIHTPDVPANLAFGGPDLRTLFFTARTSVYTLRVRYALRSRRLESTPANRFLSAVTASWRQDP